MRRWYHYNFYRPSRPREARGGIRTQSRRGAFGESWWARRWIKVLEGFDIGARLGRGRSYARRGQVLSIEIERGMVKAKVQGSRPQPYQVGIKVKTLSRAEWEKLAKALSRQALFAAKLLAGEMPEQIEDAFRDAHLSLFPSRGGDLKTECSCPDWSNPCKHIAAVYYLLGEEFDRDPFLIFKLRGMKREELTGLVGSKAGGKGKAGRKKAKPVSLDEQDEAPSPAEPLPAQPEAFWGRIDGQDDLYGEVATPPVPAALPKRLGNFPFWRGEERFLPALESIYRKASPAGLDVFLVSKQA